MNGAPLRLEIEGVSKSFPGVKALQGASLALRPGEIHGLLGENGAGKSTLLRILSGVFRPDAGSIAIDGNPVALRGPVSARRAGISMIHQELQQVPELTVAQNMFLGHPMTQGAGLFVRRRAQERRAAEMLADLDPTIPPTAPIRSLKVAERQIVEIGRALLDEARVLAMDEPTSSLTPAEFERLAAVIQRLAARGVSIIYVSHKMGEVFRLCTRATILRDGQVVDRVDLASTTEASVVSKMVGRTLAHTEHRCFATPDVLLSVRGLASVEKIRDVSFDLRRGEVLGIAGLIGAGRTELLRLIAGVDRASAGHVEIDGRRISMTQPRDAIAAGIGLVPEERKRDGIVPLRSVIANMALPSMRRFAPTGLIRRTAVRRVCEPILADIALRPFLVDRPIGLFSGGNQQKAIVGRWIASGTRVLLFDEPTRGIDIGAKTEIYGLIERLAAEGKGVIVVSSELPEILRVSDRVLVMREGRVAAELPREALSEAAIAAHAVPQSGQVPQSGHVPHAGQGAPSAGS